MVPATTFIRAHTDTDTDRYQHYTLVTEETVEGESRMYAKSHNEHLNT